MPGAIHFRLLSLLPLAFSLCVHGQAAGKASGNASNPLPAKTLQMLNAQVVWDSGFNRPNGPRLQFAQFAELATPDGHLARYRIYAPGAPEDTPYILAAWKIGASLDDLEVLSSAVYVNRKGLLLNRQPAAAEQDSETLADDVEFELSAQAADGEPLRLVLRSPDNKIMIPGTLVPFPIESADKSCKLTALLATSEGQAILLYGDGFPPNAQVVEDNDSSGELKHSTKPADANGHVQFVALPYVIGKTAGVLKDTLSTKDCSVTVSIPWGAGSYHRH